jgi:cation diffusion facilitator CzcD-associated flavoprotein CzcO
MTPRIAIIGAGPSGLTWRASCISAASPPLSSSAKSMRWRGRKAARSTCMPNPASWR